MSQSRSILSPPPKRGRRSHRETEITVRVVLVVVLAITFVGTLRWAMNVTQANARQVSRNVLYLKKRLDVEPPHTQQRSQTPGPVIEPAEDTHRKASGKR
jgi:hypothetical protein